MADLIGKIVSNRYRIDTLLGHGGMGDVYKVWDNQRGVFLAMKVLHDDLAEDRVFLRRFAREAETLSTLQHPHIVRFYGLEQEGRLTFMLMDYIEGTTLRRQIFDNQKPFSTEQVLQVIKPVCSALHYAHQMGRIHCDIKPANVMVKSNGEVLVADFGIARMMENSTTTTMVGAGTPAYMAPEQILGKNPVPQTDIYALGIMLYEMLTGGERPFTGEHAETDGSTAEKVRWEQVKTKPASPRTYNPNISPQLEAVVLKCLQKNPEDRYPDAFSLLNALSVGSSQNHPIGPVVAIEQNPGSSLPIKQNKAAEQVRPNTSRKKLTSPLIWFFGGAILILLCLIAGGGLLTFYTSSVLSATVATIPSPTSATPAPTNIILPSATSTLILTNTPAVSPTPSLQIGSTLTRDADRMVMLYVPAGEFTMGNNDGTTFEQPEHNVYLDAFWIDQTEVTNTMYAKCVSDGGCNSSGSSERSAKYAAHPVVNIEWKSAQNYCEWAGARLPTEAEWEKSARGTDKRLYPWGNGKDPSKYYIYASQPLPVGNLPSGASPYGVLDMVGGVTEWVNDWYADTYYQNSPSTNPLGPDTGQSHVLRGGSWLVTVKKAELMVWWKPRAVDTYPIVGVITNRFSTNSIWTYSVSYVASTYPNREFREVINFNGFRCARNATSP